MFHISFIFPCRDRSRFTAIGVTISWLYIKYSIRGLDDTDRVIDIKNQAKVATIAPSPAGIPGFPVVFMMIHASYAYVKNPKTMFLMLLPFNSYFKDDFDYIYARGGVDGDSPKCQTNRKCEQSATNPRAFIYLDTE